MTHPRTVWIFCAEGSTRPSGVFTDEVLAEDWIRRHSLSGLLTEYPLDTGIYEWTISKGFFEPKYPSQQSASFIGRFTSAYQNHFHFQNGEKD
jgi:hypothetical protein